MSWLGERVLLCGGFTGSGSDVFMSNSRGCKWRGTPAFILKESVLACAVSAADFESTLFRLKKLSTIWEADGVEILYEDDGRLVRELKGGRVSVESKETEWGCIAAGSKIGEVMFFVTVPRHSSQFFKKSEAPEEGGCDGVLGGK